MERCPECDEELMEEGESMEKSPYGDIKYKKCNMCGWSDRSVCIKLKKEDIN